MVRVDVDDVSKHTDTSSGSGRVCVQDHTGARSHRQQDATARVPMQQEAGRGMAWREAELEAEGKGCRLPTAPRPHDSTPNPHTMVSLITAPARIRGGCSPGGVGWVIGRSLAHLEVPLKQSRKPFGS